jgi:FkbM family methyltransferase
VTPTTVRKDALVVAERFGRVIPAPIRSVLVPFVRPLARAWERRRLTRLYRSIVSPGDLVFDVGAHTGAMTEILLRAGARVVCVDPQPACVEILRTRYGQRQDVQIEAVGVGSEVGELEFSICSEGPAMSTFSPEWKSGRFSHMQWNQTAKVPVVTLDTLIAKHGMPRFCKIDVEGFEVQVLQGLSRPVPILCFEFTREFFQNAVTCVRHLEQLGTTTFQVSLGSGFRFSFSDWTGSAELLRFLESRPEPDLWGDIYARTIDG